MIGQRSEIKLPREQATNQIECQNYRQKKTNWNMIFSIAKPITMNPTDIETAAQQHARWFLDQLRQGWGRLSPGHCFTMMMNQIMYTTTRGSICHHRLVEMGITRRKKRRWFTRPGNNSRTMTTTRLPSLGLLIRNKNLLHLSWNPKSGTILWLDSKSLKCQHTSLQTDWYLHVICGGAPKSWLSESNITHELIREKFVGHSKTHRRHKRTFQD